MKRTCLIIMYLTTIGLLSSSATGGEIIQDQHTNQYGFGAQILSYSPIGQTFTAEDAKIQYIGFGICAMNPELSFVPVTVELFEGSDLGGISLGVRPLQNIKIGSGFLDADFSFATLTVGNVYTALLSTINARSGVYGEWWKADYDGHILRTDPYAGGVGFSNESQYIKGEFDLVFHVVPVPEPAALFRLGFGAVMVRKKTLKNIGFFNLAY